MRFTKHISCALFFTIIIAVLPLHVSAADSKPRVIVESCVVEGGGLTSGSECELKITLRNMSNTLRVSSILISGNWSSSSPPPVDFKESNQLYVSSIGPTQTRDVVFALKTQQVNISALDAISLFLDINYSYEGSLDNSNIVTLRLPVGGEQTNELVSIPTEDDLVIDKPDLSRSVLFETVDAQLFFFGTSAICAVAAIIFALVRYRRNK